ncbi:MULTISPECIES: hypothetical protein [unclassified Acinetobacter]|uniref:hypothetical protein n=1 Tax=unclassified Acinetobacter TaxID=196816 RepID=UPI0015D1FEAC|nr:MULTISPECIES: hypothetical protein [unclassified Acinetobacter]
MATDVDVQYFSHLNGLTLGNNWGDLIRLLDKALVTGINFTEITSASINEQGDVIINLFAAHNAMLFQVVELSGFNPASLNQKYRIKGVPSATQLILKPKNEIGATTITTVGEGKLASLGYDIIFRDENDVKRVYRAKNPTAQHPFIRVDESLASETGSYASTYAKYAMVGLLEHMDHIDDYQNPDVLQLPFDPADPAKNWKITGTGSSVVRGWARWHWARGVHGYSSGSDTASPAAGNRNFTLVGDKDAFYMFTGFTTTASDAKQLLGCGLHTQSIENINPNWFMFSPLHTLSASTSIDHASTDLCWPLMYSSNCSKFIINKLNTKENHTIATPIIPDLLSGKSGLYDGSSPSALEIPFFDADKKLRGTLKHILYAGEDKSAVSTKTTVSLAGASMYVYDGSPSSPSTGGCYFYLGELE